MKGTKMGSCNDPHNPLALSDIFVALRTERAYQVRRWGRRQPDGSLMEARHTISDFVVYMLDYYIELQSDVTRLVELAPALDDLRKIVCLGLACLEQNDHGDDDGEQAITLDDIFETVWGNRMVPLSLNPFFTDYMLKIHYGLTGDEEKSKIFRRSLFSVKDIKRGELFTEENVRSIRPGHGLKPKYLEKILKKPASCKIKRGTPIRPELVQ